MAALAFQGHFAPPLPRSSSVASPSLAGSPLLGFQSRAISVPRLCASTTDVQLASTAPTNEFWERLKSPVMARRKTALQRLSSLGSLSNISLPGPSRENYPSGRRHHHDRRGSVEPLVTIKCQRMNSDKRREEVIEKSEMQINSCDLHLLCVTCQSNCIYIFLKKKNAKN